MKTFNLALLRISPGLELVTMLRRIAFLMPVTRLHTHIHTHSSNRKQKRTERMGTPASAFSFFPAKICPDVLPPWPSHTIFLSLLYPFLSALPASPPSLSPSPPPFSSLLWNEAAQLSEGQCCTSPRDRREGHVDEDSRHHILQLHIKCTVYGKDTEGAGRARGWFGEKG